jgi:hypothetical protein
MAKKSDAWYLLRKNGEPEYAVTKYEGSRMIAKYMVKDGECSCPAGQHNTPCKHLDMVQSLTIQPHGKKAAIATARAAAVKVIEAIEPHYKLIKMNSYDYVDGSQVMVWSVNVQAKVALDDRIKGKNFTMTGIVDGFRVHVVAEG